MRFSWVSLLVVLPFALSMCGQDSNGDEGDDDSDDGVDLGGSSNGGNGRGGANGGDAGAPSNGGSSSGTTGEAGAAGEGTGTGGSSGTGGGAGSAGTAGSGGCEEGPADVLILLDRSASMRDPPEETQETRPKWEVAIPPLVEALSETTAPIRWALKTFSEGGEEVPACAAGSVTAAIDVPIAEGNASAVVQAIQATSPDGSATPTGDAVKQALAYLQTLDSDNPKYVLLVTDGEPTCINVTATSAGTEGQEAARPYAVQALNDTLAAGIPTFVVGIGTNKETAVRTLNEMAVAGGRPVPQANPLESLFYLANGPDGVTSAFDSIMRSTSGCVGPTGSLPLPYTDDFETSEAADWRFLSVPWAVTDDGGNNVLQLSSTGDSETTWAVGGDRNWGDVRVEMRVKFVSGEAMILLSPRWQTLDSYTFVEYEAVDKPKLRNRFNGSTQDVLTAANDMVFALGQWHTVAVTLQGANATLEIDGTVIGTGAISTPVPRGGIGIAVENGIVAIDDVRVTAP